MGPEVTSYVVKLTIGGEPKHISQEALLPRPWLPLRYTHHLDVVTPLTGGLRQRCLMRRPSHQRWILHLHVWYPEMCLSFSMVHQFQVGRLYKWPVEQCDKRPKTIVIDQSLEIIFHQKNMYVICPTLWVSDQVNLLQLTKKYWSRPVTWNLFLNKKYILYLHNHVLYPYTIFIDCSEWMYKYPYHNSELSCCSWPLEIGLSQPLASIAAIFGKVDIMAHLYIQIQYIKYTINTEI